MSFAKVGRRDLSFFRASLSEYKKTLDELEEVAAATKSQNQQTLAFLI